MLGRALSCCAVLCQGREGKGRGWERGCVGAALPKFRPSNVICRLGGRIVFESVWARSVSALTMQHLAAQAALWRWPLIIP